MKNTRYVSGLLGCAMLFAATVASPVSSVSADDGDATQVEEVAAAISEVASDSLATNTTNSADLAVAATNEDSTVEIPVDPADGISVTSSSGVEVGIGLPGANRADDAAVPSAGTAVYTDSAPEVSIAAQALSDGGVRALITIEGPSAPTQYRFPIEVPAGGFLDAQDDGTINVVDGDGVPISHFKAPWATDSTGAAVPTTLTVDGTSIVQTVSHTGNYPVVADPQYTWGWITGTVYYNRAETRSMKTLSYGAVVAAGLCAAFAVQTAGAACALAAAFYAQWNYVAGNAYGDGKCMKIKVPTFWASAYSGGYCR